MPVKALIFWILSIASSGLYAQNGLYVWKEAWEFGINGGGAVYFGDLNTESDFSQIRPGFGAYTRINFDDRIAFKVSAFQTQVTYSDHLSSNAFQQARKLSFRSNILQASGQFEFNFFPYSIGSDRDFFSPYVLLGFTMARINPQAYDSSLQEWVDLQPLGTEGQNSPTARNQSNAYGAMQPCASFGGGFKFNIAGTWSVDLEFNYKYLFSDYLDDVSTEYYSPSVASPQAQYFADPSSIGTADQIVGRAGKYRGDKQDNDAYMVISLGTSFRIRTSSCPPPSNKGF